MHTLTDSTDKRQLYDGIHLDGDGRGKEMVCQLKFANQCLTSEDAIVEVSHNRSRDGSRPTACSAAEHSVRQKLPPR